MDLKWAILAVVGTMRSKSMPTQSVWAVVAYTAWTILLQNLQSIRYSLAKRGWNLHALLTISLMLLR